MTLSIKPKTVQIRFIFKGKFLKNQIRGAENYKISNKEIFNKYRTKRQKIKFY